MNDRDNRRLLGILHRTLVEMVSSEDKADLTARQTAILLTCHLSEAGQTVRGVAADLRISKPAVTRAIDKLAAMGLVKRAEDPADQRSVLLVGTKEGRVFLQGLGRVMATAENESSGRALRRAA
jgi:DNA-binding MarR family transcriptional regulator